MDFQKLVEFRRSHRSYVPGKNVSQETLEKLLTQAALSPSSTNQQGWEIWVLASQSERERLYKEACPQQQVLDCSALFVICGNLEQYKNMPEITAKTASMDQSLRDRLVQDTKNTYGANPQFARDEAIRSASLFAMSLMFAATDAGFGTCPMIGFDSDKLCAAFGIRPPYFPVLLVSLGTVKNPPFPRGYRRPVGEFARFA